jgi:hypothetical protein
MLRLCAILAAGVLGVGGGLANGSELEDALDDGYRGAWATLANEVYSSCSGTYSNNTIGPAGVVSKAGHRFAVGELVKIDKVKVKRSRIDLMATLASPILVPRVEGPFTLYDELECKAQLIIEVPRAVIRSDDSGAAHEAISAVLTVHGSRHAAEAAEGWNGRRRAPFPNDYELTLAAYERWSAEQNNLAVSAAIADAVDQTADAAEEIESGDDYLAGFAAGAVRARGLSFGSCESMINAFFSSWRERPPSGSSASWKRGFADGQQLVFHALLARELQGCFVPLPPEVLP